MGATQPESLPMRARLYAPARQATQSGQGKTDRWVLDFGQGAERRIDPLMGWTSSDDTQTQVRLSFATEAEARAYAEGQGWMVQVVPPQTRKPNIRPGGYGENFATGRREPWSH